MRALTLGCVALAASLSLGARAGQAQAPRVARITHYDQGSVTYSGAPVGPGVLSCSWNIPLYSTVTIDGWYTGVCLDRGDLGFSDWVDIYGGPWLADAFGDYATIEVTP